MPMQSNKLKMISMMVVFVLLTGTIVVLNRIIDREISKSSDFTPGIASASVREVGSPARSKAPAVVAEINLQQEQNIASETENSETQDVKASKPPRPRYETPLDDVELAL